MAQNAPPVPDDRDPVGKAPFTTAAGLVGLAFVLLVLCGLIAGLVSVLIERVEFPSQWIRTAAAYALYAVPTLLGLGALCALMIGSIRWAIYGRHAVGVPLAATERKQLELLAQVVQRLGVSETAKRIAYRNEDAELVRHTIEDDLQRQDFDGALVLVNEMASAFGRREEAEQYRDKIIQTRAKQVESKVAEASARVDEMIERREFDRALREASKIERVYGDAGDAASLRRNVVQAREQYKRDLERQFLEAARRDDVDAAMSLLKEMDKYLTEGEAEPFRETARGVIGKQRDNQGVQFKMAVHDREWVQAVRVGEGIIREFPNSKMADEVRGLLDLLRERAAGQRAAQSQSDRRPSPAPSSRPEAAMTEA